MHRFAFKKKKSVGNVPKGQLNYQRLRSRQMQTKLLQKSLLKLFKKVTFTVRSVGSPKIATNLAKSDEKREKTVPAARHL